MIHQPDMTCSVGVAIDASTKCTVLKAECQPVGTNIDGGTENGAIVSRTYLSTHFSPLVVCNPPPVRYPDTITGVNGCTIETTKNEKSGCLQYSVTCTSSEDTCAVFSMPVHDATIACEADVRTCVKLFFDSNLLCRFPTPQKAV